MAGDFSRAVFERCAVGLADDGEELVDGVVCVYGYDFAAEVFEFHGGFWYEVFEVYAQNDTNRYL